MQGVRSSILLSSTISLYGAVARRQQLFNARLMTAPFCFSEKQARYEGFNINDDDRSGNTY